MTNADLLREQRSRASDADSDVDRLLDFASPADRIHIGQVYDGGAMPTTVPRVYLTRPVSITSSEAEGTVIASSVDATKSVPVICLGPKVPNAGTCLIAYEIGGKWVSGTVNRAGGSTIAISGCNCAETPAVIVMTSADETCNFGILKSCVIAYGPTPAVFAPLSLGANCFLSTETFVSDYSSEEFYYLLTCNSSFYSLSRLFPVSIFGSPFREPPIYSWLIGDTGNTCTPFLMSNGFIYFGGDPACDVDLSE